MFKKNIFSNKIVGNTSWILASKVAQAILGLVISVLTARFLGPSNYGLLNYAESISAFVIPIANLGLSSVLVQELVLYPEEEGKIIGTSILLSIISSLACFGGVVLFTFIADSGDLITNVVVILYSIILFAHAFDLVQYWYQSKLLSKYTAIVSFVAYVVVSSYKVVLLVLKMDVIFFAISNSIDCFVISIMLIIIYKKLGGNHICFSSEVGKRMFNKSKYYIFSTLMITIFTQTDRIMIKLMINEEAVGYYSAAVKCSGMTGFVFAAIIDSFRPVIYNKKKNNDEVGYETNIKRLYSIIIYLAVLQCVFMTVFAKWIIFLLYGENYNDSALALQIVVWYTTFSYIGAIRSIWVLGEGKQKYLWIINISGAVINVGLNILFINYWGIYGAALSSLLTQFFTNVVMNIIVWPLSHNNMLMLKSINPKIIIDMIKSLRS